MVKPASKNLGILIGLIGVVLFSSKAIMVKLAYLYQVDTLSLLLLRMGFALPFYIAILCYLEYKQSSKIGAKTFLWLLLFGFVGYYLASYFDFLGLKYIKAGLERIILFIYPTIVVLLSYVFLKIKVSKKQRIAIAITYLGVLITFWKELSVTGSNVWLGVLLVIFSAITYASYLVGSGWLIPKLGVLRFTCYAMIVSTVCILIHYSATTPLKTVFNLATPVYVYGLGMAIIATLIPSFLVSWSIKTIGANSFSILGSVGPISTIVLAYLFLGEKLSWLQLLGMLVVIMGIIYLSINKQKP